MPLFFFHFPSDQIRDEDGLEFPDIKAARREAVRTAGHILSDLGEDMRDDNPWLMSVTDDRGCVVCALEFVVKSVQLSATTLGEM